ncbi:MAG: hypothetical protein ACPKPY_01050 [Nitrososphaeraceae archaeon]
MESAAADILGMAKTVTAIPSMIQNAKSIKNYAKKAWHRISNEDEFGEASVYFSIYLYFKNNVDYTIEGINDNICSLLKDYEHGKGYKYNFKDKSFVINILYDYSDRFYILNEHFDDHSGEEIQIPTISGISLYFQPEEITKDIISIGHEMIESIMKELLRTFEVNSMGSFMYIEGKNEQEMEIIKNKINKIIKKLDVELKIYPSSKKETKFKFDSMAVKVINDVIWS